MTTQDPEGLPERPLTFSRDGLFSGVGEGCSSIDATLLNRSALFALQDCHVLEVSGRQHRPIRCTFSWETLSKLVSCISKLHLWTLLGFLRLPKLLVRPPPITKHRTFPGPTRGRPNSPQPKIPMSSGTLFCAWALFGGLDPKIVLNHPSL